MCHRRVNRSTAIIPMPFTAITSPPSALSCAKDASSPRQIPTARNASVWWTRFGPALLAERRRARPKDRARRRKRRRAAVHSCRRRRRSEASRAHRSARTRRGLPALRLSRQRQYFRRHAHEPASGSVRRDAAKAGARSGSRTRGR